MIHPDILLIWIKQRQQELWDEAAHAAQVRQIKTVTRRQRRVNLTHTGDGVPVSDPRDKKLPAASAARTWEKQAA
jgi:hypothetical protein